MNVWIVDETLPDGQVIRPINNEDMKRIDESVLLRPATLVDLPAMIKCEEIAWEDQEQRATFAELKARITNFPDGNFVVAKGSTIFGIITFSGYHIDWSNPVFPSHKVLSGQGQANNHNPLSETLFTINVAAISDESQLPEGLTQVGTALSKGGIALAIKRGYCYIFGIGYMPVYFQYCDKMTPEEYAQHRGEKGHLIDPVMAYYDKIGMHYFCMQKDLFLDKGSLNYNPIVRWDNKFMLYFDGNDSCIFNLPDESFFDKTKCYELTWYDVKLIILKIMQMKVGKKIVVNGINTKTPAFMKDFLQSCGLA